MSDGTAEIVARFGGREARVKATVHGFADNGPVDFRTDVIGALCHVGCKAGPATARRKGRMAFHLSLRGYDPRIEHFKHDARRCRPAAPIP